MTKTFDEWMREVNQACERMTGLSTDDLPDVCYSDMYEDEVSPKSAARKAIRNAYD